MSDWPDTYCDALHYQGEHYHRVNGEAIGPFLGPHPALAGEPEVLTFAVHARSKKDAEDQGRQYAVNAGRVVLRVTAERFPNGADYMVNWLATVECGAL